MEEEGGEEDTGEVEGERDSENVIIFQMQFQGIKVPDHPGHKTHRADDNI